MENLTSLIKAARKENKADLVFKSGLVVNVFSGTVEKTDLAVSGGIIVGLGNYEGKKEIDVSGRFLSPGFIEPHFHIESTMLCPSELARLLVPRGATTLVADPHEIANVLGIAGVKYMIQASRGLPLDIFFTAPSCVPATHLETAGASLSAQDLALLDQDPSVIGLGEMMNFPGVLSGNKNVLDKIKLFEGRPIDGHAPFLSGPDLNAYILSGIGTDHECVSPKEAEEKLMRGMRIFIREGGTAKDLETLLPLVNAENFRRISFCTDDKHAGDFSKEGHLDWILRKAISLGLDPVRAITMASLNAAEAFSLKRRGALAPGYIADVCVLESLESMKVQSVYKNGQLVAKDGALLSRPAQSSIPDWASPMNLADFTKSDLKLRAEADKVRVIEIVPGQLITNHLVVDTPMDEGFVCADIERDLIHLFVLERHKKTGNIGRALVKGFGITKGAIATSVAHDSHNIIAVGVDLDDTLTAIEKIKRMKGGMVLVINGDVIAPLALPIAGLMSPSLFEEVIESELSIKLEAKRTGCVLDDPFMTLSFLALPVIPSLKLTDKGLVDVDKFEIVDLFVE